MPTHARAAIVAAAVTAVDNLTTTGARVYAGRVAPQSAASAPFLLVYGRREQSQPATMKGAARSLQRELTLSIEGVAPETTDVDTTLDTIALEVETAIAADPTLGGTCRDLWLVATDLGASVEGETRIGHVRLDFTIHYFTAANAPATAL